MFFTCHSHLAWEGGRGTSCKQGYFSCTAQECSQECLQFSYLPKDRTPTLCPPRTGCSCAGPVLEPQQGSLQPVCGERAGSKGKLPLRHLAAATVRGCALLLTPSRLPAGPRARTPADRHGHPNCDDVELQGTERGIGAWWLRAFWMFCRSDPVCWVFRNFSC